MGSRLGWAETRGLRVCVHVTLRERNGGEQIYATLRVTFYARMATIIHIEKRAYCG